MLTEVRQGTSQVGAQRNRGYEDHELVFVLNKMQERFIDLQCELQDDGTAFVKHPQKIAPLIKGDVALPTYRSDATYAVLPGDLRYITGKGAKFACPPAHKVVPPVPLSEVALVKSTKVAGPYYGAVVQMNGVTRLNVPALYPYNDELAKTETVRVLASFLRELGYTVYESTFGNRPNKVSAGVAADTLIIANPHGGVVTVSIDGVVQSSTDFNFNGIDSAGSYQMIPLDFVSHMMAHEYIKTPYFKPSVGKALGTVSGGELKVFGPDNGIVVGVSISYVRKPRPLSVILSRDCELPPSSCREICDLAIEYLTKGSHPEHYQVTRADNDKRTTI